MTVAGDYAYIAECDALGDPVAWLFRFHVSDGSRDAAYAVSVPLSAECVDLALASDQDGADSEIYLAAIASDGSLRFFYDSSADGTTFEESSPSPPISDACCGLDMTFNPGSADHDVFFSYFDTTDVFWHIWRSYPWELVYTGGFGGSPDLKTAISAHGDSVIVCFAVPLANGLEMYTWRSYDAGDSWHSSVVDQPNPGEGGYSSCDVTARGGEGFAITYVHEEGAFDPVYLRRHTGGASDPWSERVVINETDVAALPVFETTLNFFPPATYGVAYLEESMLYPYFDSFDILPFSDGFESGDTSAWSAQVP
jgi:hypothetical protein